MYGTVEELAALVQVDPVSNSDALTRCMDAAALEIDSETGRAGVYNPAELDLVTEVNLERAVEHWSQLKVPFGFIGLGAETSPGFISRDSWDRHALKLLPVKSTWGVA